MSVNMGITKKWAVCQKLSPTEQLNAGIRYFDIRVAYDSDQSMYRVCHTLLGDPLEDIMREISDFLNGHSKEVVLLDFNHFHGLTNDKHGRLLDMITSIFGSKLCPVDNGVTLESMWQNKYQVLAFYHDKSAASHRHIWPRSYIQSHWPNADVPDVLLTTVGSLIGRGRRRGTFHVLQGILTPSTGLVAKSLPGVSFFTGVSDLETHVTKSGINDKFVQLLDRSSSRGSINICIVDFVEQNNCKFAMDICNFNSR